MPIYTCYLKLAYVGLNTNHNTKLSYSKTPLVEEYSNWVQPEDKQPISAPSYSTVDCTPFGFQQYLVAPLFMAFSLTTYCLLW